MLAGPPRLVSLISTLFLLGLGWWYLHLAHVTSSKTGQHPHSLSLSTGFISDGLDFSIPLKFTEGVPKPAGENYTHVMVLAKTVKEDIGWMSDEIPDTPLVVYEVDNPSAENKIPRNKGREAMVYLSYIIDHYHSLPDTVLFMHSHRYAWHNNMLLGLDAAQMIKRLNHARVARLGYMNVRCHHEPGCPDWIHMDRPGGDFDFYRKPEEIYIRRHIWEELHPGAPIPPSLSGICCAQFAVSRERIHQVPLKRFIHYRNWLLETNIDDQYSGRIFEYIWHYIFTGHAVLCPPMNTCYCDGYGFCFGGRQKFEEYWQKSEQRNTYNEALKVFVDREEEAKKEGRTVEWNETEKRRMEGLRGEIAELDLQMSQVRIEAMDRGNDPEERAKETESWDSEGIFEYLPGWSKGPPV